MFYRTSDGKLVIDPRMIGQWIILHTGELLALIAAIALAVEGGRRYPKYRWLIYIGAILAFFLIRAMFAWLSGRIEAAHTV